jgi:hypothetical protein
MISIDTGDYQNKELQKSTETILFKKIIYKTGVLNIEKYANFCLYSRHSSIAP